MAQQQTKQRRRTAVRKARQRALFAHAVRLGVRGINRMKYAIGEGRSYAPDTAWRLIRQFVDHAEAR